MGLRAGILYLKTDSTMYDAKGEFTYNLGQNKREPIVGADGIHDYAETPQPAFIEGAITDSSGLDLKTLTTLKDVTATLELANGKTILIPNAYYAGEGNVKTKEAEITVKFVSSSGPGREL